MVSAFLSNRETENKCSTAGGDLPRPGQALVLTTNAILLGSVLAMWSAVLVEAVLFLKTELLLGSGPFHLDFGVPLGQKVTILEPHVV